MNKYIISLLLLLFLGTAVAHDPGLSLLEMRLNNDNITINLSLAQADLESVINLDTNADTEISQAELDKANHKLTGFASNGIQLSNTQQIITAEQIYFQSAPSNTVKVALSYPAMQGELKLKIPMLAEFSRGHRQQVTVLGADGQPAIQRIISKDSAMIQLKAEGLHQDSVFHNYFVEGVWHIWIGFDHILFLLTLLLPAVLIYRHQQWQSVNQLFPVLSDTLSIVTCFTLAHSITLSLAALKLVQIPAHIIEPVIAFSVLITSLNNLKPLFYRTRWLLAFGFGLIHGFGFASVLADLGMNQQALFTSLLGFNLGVEAGQLAIVVTVVPVAYLIRQSAVYRLVVFKGGSVTAALIAGMWMVERIADIDLFNLTIQSIS